MKLARDIRELLVRGWTNHELALAAHQELEDGAAEVVARTRGKAAADFVSRDMTGRPPPEIPVEETRRMLAPFENKARLAPSQEVAFTLSKLYESRDQLLGATAFAERAYAIEPSQPAALRYAACLRKIRFLEDALNVYADVLRADASNRFARTGAAAVLREAGRLIEARRHVRVVLRDRPDDLHALSCAGGIEWDAGQRKLAAEYFARAARIEGSSGTAAGRARLLAHELREAGDTQTAELLEAELSR